MHRPARHRWAVRVSTVGMVVAGALVLLCVYWLVRPYNDFTTDPGPYPLTNVTYYEDGIPVVPHGTDLSFTLTGVCNFGVDTISIRWFDLYDKFLFFEPSDVPSASISAPPWEFYEALTGELDCPSDVPVTVKVPNYIEHGYIYRFRFEVVYKPNPIRTISKTMTTERFRLVDAPVG